MTKILIWDIESTNLNADFGYILCCGIKEYGTNKIICPSVADYQSYKGDPTNDSKLVKDVADILSEADIWVTWYGKRFDAPFLNSRLIYHGYNPLPKVTHIDGWETSRRQLRLHSNRLASAAEFLGVEEKTPLSGPIWIKASAGDPKSLAYVIKHCKQDVVVLEQAYQKLRPTIISHPNLGIISGDPEVCPRCGARSLESRGKTWTTCGFKNRFCCKKCGGWSTGPVKTTKGIVRPE